MSNASLNASETASPPGPSDPTSAAPTEEDEAGTRSNPYPIGQSVTSDDWQVTLGTPREATAEAAAENPFNDEPAPGMEFWMVPVSATYTGDETGSLMFGLPVQFVGSDNRAYSDRCGVIPNDVSDVGDLNASGSAEGNVCIAVPAGADGLWAVKPGFLGDPVFFAAN